MVGVHLAGDLHEIEVAAPLAWHRRVVERLILLDAAIRAEEPDFVAQDRPAERQVGLDVACACSARCLRRCCLERLRNHEERHRPVQLVAAALGDDVHELPDHAGAVRRLGAERLDLHVLDRFVIEFTAKTSPPNGSVTSMPSTLVRRSDPARFLCVGPDVDARHHQPDVLKSPLRRHRHECQRRVVDVDRQSRPVRDRPVGSHPGP